MNVSTFTLIPVCVAAMWLGSASQAPVPAAAQPASGDPAAIAAGAALFQRSCASCHNVEGRGPSLATGVFTHGGDDAQIAQTIRAGVPGTQMPPFQALSVDAVRQLVAYIRSLSSSVARPPAPASAAATDPGEGGLTYERIRRAASEPHNWLTYWGDYQGTHFSGLQQVTASNVGRLQAA